jgi:hypothetical protein
VQKERGNCSFKTTLLLTSMVGFKEIGLQLLKVLA